jgi:hypothetical protein
VGDNQKVRSGFEYVASGKDANALPTNSTWTQKNTTTGYERKIFRYDLKDAIPFPDNQIPNKYRSVSKLVEEEPVK